jgi:hypothetical protein
VAQALRWGKGASKHAGLAALGFDVAALNVLRNVQVPM